jgi:hypothetical protein
MQNMAYNGASSARIEEFTNVVFAQHQPEVLMGGIVNRLGFYWKIERQR